MKGIRVYTQEELRDTDGAYFFSDDTQSWWCRTPNGHAGCLASHEVTEHEDGTISVLPSILVTTQRNGIDIELYHGYITGGEWT